MYTGKTIVPAFKYEPEEFRTGLHEGLVDEEIFTAMQNVLSGKKKPYKGHMKEESLPLIECYIAPDCNNAMTGSGSSGNGSIYPYYHFQRTYGCNYSIKADGANTGFGEFLKSLEPAPGVLNLYNQILKDVFKANEVDRESESTKNLTEISTIDKKLQT